MKNRTYKIYCLIDPRNGEIFYVGATIMELDERLSGHCSYRTKGSEVTDKRQKIIYRLRKLGIKPDIVCLQECKECDVDMYETEYYYYFYNMGFEMLQDYRMFNYRAIQGDGVSRSRLDFDIFFDNREQYSSIKKLAHKNKRSLNSEILHMVDIKILNEKTKGQAIQD